MPILVDEERDEFYNNKYFIESALDIAPPLNVA